MGPSQSRKIAIVGRIPPPYGGVTVHLSRLLSRLRKEQIPYLFFDLDGRSEPDLAVSPAAKTPLGLLRQLGVREHACVHFHASNPALVLMAGIVQSCWRRKIAFTLHGEGILRLCSAGPVVYRLLLPRVLRNADHIFPINLASPAKLRDYGIEDERISWTAAYLPPGEGETHAGMPESASEFLASHKPVIACQGSFGAFHRGVEIYRFDLIARMLARLKTVMPELGVISMITQTIGENHRMEVLALRKALGLENDWLIQEVAVPAVPVYARSSVFLRPTESDGDSVSIRECLDLGVPVLASDAVPRPEGCTLFRRGDLDDLCVRMMQLLQNMDQAAESLAGLPRVDHAMPILAYYRSILSVS